jgi:acyl carrier protein
VVMAEQEIFDRFAALIEEYFEIPANDVTRETDLVDDLQIDSLSMVEIVVSMTIEFNIEIPDEAIQEFKTVGDVVNYVQRIQGADVSA